MDEAARYTAEHSVMEAGIEIRELKHKLEVAEEKIKKLEKKLAESKIQKLQLEIAELKSAHLDPDLLALDIGKSVKEEPELRSVMSEKYNKFGEEA